MNSVDDTGKVWIPGKMSPGYAVRVGDKVYVPGKEEDQTVEAGWNEGFVYFDLHDTEKKWRVARRFNMELEPTTPASLFNGFEQTKHCDMLVVDFEKGEFEEFECQDEEYNQHAVVGMNSIQFWEFADFKS